ncbi:MAG: DUF1566 domain-containing protein [Spirochaetota bacterium]
MKRVIPLFLLCWHCSWEQNKLASLLELENNFRKIQLEKQEKEAPKTVLLSATGQKKCFSDEIPYAEISCNSPEKEQFPMQDADKQRTSAFLVQKPLGFPEQRITQDYASGLRWKYCPQGKQGDFCDATEETEFNLIAAIESCRSLNLANQEKGYAGISGWRLPSVQELATILDYGHSSPVLNQAIFPGTSIDRYWTISPNREVTDSYYSLNMHSAEVASHTFDNKHSVRCVAGRMLAKPILQFQKNQLVANRKDGLLWMKCPDGMIGGDCRGFPIHRNWQQALQYCANKNMEEKVWRLPDINELKTLFSPGNEQLFPFKLSGPLWSSTSFPETTETYKAYAVFPHTGRVIAINKNPPKGLFTLCVTDLQTYKEEVPLQDTPLLQEVHLQPGDFKGTIDGRRVNFHIPYGITTKTFSLSFRLAAGASAYRNDKKIVARKLQISRKQKISLSLRLKEREEVFRFSLIRSQPILDTGQKQCFNDEIFYSQFECGYKENLDFPGEDANFAGIPIARKYLKKAFAKFPLDKTVFDSKSNIYWQACTEGMGGEECRSGEPEKVTWQKAKASCKALNQKNKGLGYAGLKTWRLPEVTELFMLADRNYAKPAIDQVFFPNTFRYFYWTATTAAYSSKDAWAINFSNGKTNYVNPKKDTDSLKTNEYMLRCVASPPPPKQKLQDNLDGTVTDTVTDLTWQKCLPGQYGSECKGYIIPFNWQAALEYCAELRLAGRTWRLPNINELQSMIDYQRYYNALDTKKFQNIKFPFYTFWSSTSSNRFVSDFYAFALWVDYGNVKISPKFYAHSTRCVSGGFR